MTDITHFRDQLDRLGADLERWPADARAAAHALLATSAEAREALAAARRLDRQLARLGDGAASTALRSRIMAIPAAQPRRMRQGSPVRRFATPWHIGMAAAAASLVLGLALGRSDVIPLDDTSFAYEVAALDYAALPALEDLP